MQILSQDRTVMVQLEQLHAISVYNMADLSNGKKNERKYRILGWYGQGENDCWGLGDYETEQRAKDIVKAIWEKSGEYWHRKGGPAILQGSSPVDEMFWVLPKVFEMPED